MSYNTLLVLSGAGLLGALCGVVGSFAVLRRRALLGDALAHATLPGIALAFWITGLKSLPALLSGALATGVLGIAALSWIRRHTRTREDAALGLVLSVFFGVGIALSRHIQNAVPDGSQAGLDTYLLGKTAGIVLQDVLAVAAVSLFALLGVLLLFKELRLVTFDAGFARSLGWNTGLLDLIAMGFVAIAVVIGLPMVGIVMVAALTILPAVAARFWTDRLGALLALAAGFGASSAACGALVSAAIAKMPTGPVTILIAGGLFVFSALFAPTRGALSASLRRRRERLGLGTRLVLKELSERGPLAQPETALQASGVPRAKRAVARSVALGWAAWREGDLALTPAGEAALREARS